jgi:hypothetical protein
MTRRGLYGKLGQNRLFHTIGVSNSGQTIAVWATPSALVLGDNRRFRSLGWNYDQARTLSLDAALALLYGWEDGTAGVREPRRPRLPTLDAVACEETDLPNRRGES